MPFGSISGVSCVNCGRGINTFPWITSLPDPFPVTCPYCDCKALYPKSSIHVLQGDLAGEGFGTVKTKSAIPGWQMLSIFALLFAVIVLAIATKNGGHMSISW